ncbi:hypothetical protein F5146DRAFT_1074288 [Armillaria mellea]|nr:hypothetical protein F5146DRAFT_1074288 [Armillaria mellea]
MPAEMGFAMSEALVEMRHRVSTDPVDKIAGLSFLMLSPSIPAYYESATLEDAWTALVDLMPEFYREQLFFLCAEPGDGGAKWRPSWDWLMIQPLLAFHRRYPGAFHFVNRDETGDEAVCDAKCIVGKVRGLAAVEGDDRHGELIVECDDGIARFKITASHTYPIPEDTYTPIYGRDFDKNPYVVGRSLPGRKFEKVSVLEMSKEEHCRLRDLGIIVSRRYILI